MAKIREEILFSLFFIYLLHKNHPHKIVSFFSTTELLSTVVMHSSVQRVTNESTLVRVAATMNNPVPISDEGKITMNGISILKSPQLGKTA